MRIAILGLANRQNLRQQLHRPAWIVTAAAVSLCLAIFARGLGHHRGKSPAMFSPPSPAPGFHIEPVGDAAWQVDPTGDHAELRLTAGRISLQVEKVAPGQTFKLRLPDGELEVRGTRFFAEVQSGHTEEVEVVEGWVDLRLKANEPLVLSAGQRWRREESSPKTAASGQKTPSNVGDSVEVNLKTLASRILPAGRAGPPRGVGTSPRRAEPTPIDERTARVAAGKIFAAGMAAFDRQDYTQAEELLTEFERRVPGDARTEDVAFLRIILRSGLGDGKGARQRAHAYLATHPKGFHQAEVESFLQRKPVTPSDDP